jgi:hypothetical protein
MGKKFDKLSIGIGMIPRGEVGLIFANIGLTLMIAGQPVVTQQIFAALVVMVIATTVITPPLLGWSLRRKSSSAQRISEPEMVAVFATLQAELPEHEVPSLPPISDEELEKAVLNLLYSPNVRLVATNVRQSA